MTTKTDPRAKSRWRRRRREIFRGTFTPKPRLTVSEWADRYRKLSGEAAEPGQWSTDRVPYLREIMDSISDPTVREIAVMKSARVGFTEGVIGNAIGYHIHQEACALLVVQPSQDDAEGWSKENLAPMIAETPALAEKVSDAKGRDSDNTLLAKRFRGGSLRITSAISPRGLRRRAARKVLFDEVDGYPTSAGSEGDPIALGKKRAQTYWNRQYVYGSTPTIKELSRIEKLYELSDQRRFLVACPHCGHRQELRFGGRDSNFGLKWDTVEIGERKVVVEDSVGYLCEGCATLIDERHKPAMVLGGEWVAKNPGAPIRGYHISALYSLFDGARWPVLIQEWLDAQGDNEQLKAFVNTVLGLPWEEAGEAVTPRGLEARAESYPAEVPAGVGVLTAGVDVQGDRLELLIRGWGVEEESWMIAHHRLYGDPRLPEVWQQLDYLLLKRYEHESGGELRIQACMVDSGFLATEAVYGFVKPRQARGVYASKGIDQRGKAPLSRASRANRDGVKLFTIGTYSMKDALFSRLKIGRPGPKFMHFRKADSEMHNGADAEFFAQFAAEKLIIRRVGGRTVREYRQVRERNEAIDLEVLNLAALHSLGAAIRGNLGRWVEKVRTEGEAAAQKKKAKAVPVEEVPRRAARGNARRGGWATGWK